MRRRIFTLLLLLGAAVMVQAQSPKMWIGGSMDIATTKSGTVKTGAISFMPEFGYVVNEKVKVGAGVGYTTVYTHVTSDDKSSDNIFSIKLFGRYYNQQNKLYKSLKQIVPNILTHLNWVSPFRLSITS